MNKHADIALSHGAALHGHPLFEDHRDDVRRRAEQVAREKDAAVRTRFGRRREAWLGRSSLFSFGELADVHVSRMPVDRDRDKGRRDFFELLKASIASGEFERAGRTRVCVIFESKSYRLTPELMRAGDGDAMQSLLRECWTLPEIGIEWCERLKIELPNRWKLAVVSRPGPDKRGPDQSAEKQIIDRVVQSLRPSRKCPMQAALDAIGHIQMMAPEKLRQHQKIFMIREVEEFCRKIASPVPCERTIRTARDRFLKAYVRAISL
jgi:hypothetical protein